MARKALKPCRHPGCPALTREGWCPKHQPEPRQAQRKESAAWHGWYSRAVWTQELRPAQLMREPFCRVCAAKGWRTMWSPSGGTGRCSSARPTTRACASSTTTRRPPGSRRKGGVRPGDFDGCFPREATSAPGRVGRRRRAGKPTHAQRRSRRHPPPAVRALRDQGLSAASGRPQAPGDKRVPLCVRRRPGGPDHPVVRPVHPGAGGGEPGPHPAPALAGV